MSQSCVEYVWGQSHKVNATRIVRIFGLPWISMWMLVLGIFWDRWIWHMFLTTICAIFVILHLCCYENSSLKMLEPLNDHVNPPHHVDCGRLQWNIDIEHTVLYKHMSFRNMLLDSHVITHVNRIWLLFYMNRGYILKFRIRALK